MQCSVYIGSVPTTSRSPEWTNEKGDAGCGSPGVGGGEVRWLSCHPRSYQHARCRVRGTHYLEVLQCPVPPQGLSLGLDPDYWVWTQTLYPDYWVWTQTTGSVLVLLGLDWFYWVWTGCNGSGLVLLGVMGS